MSKNFDMPHHVEADFYENFFKCNMGEDFYGKFKNM